MPSGSDSSAFAEVLLPPCHHFLVRHGAVLSLLCSPPSRWDAPYQSISLAHSNPLGHLQVLFPNFVRFCLFCGCFLVSRWLVLSYLFGPIFLDGACGAFFTTFLKYFFQPLLLVTTITSAEELVSCSFTSGLQAVLPQNSSSYTEQAVLSWMEPPSTNT